MPTGYAYCSSMSIVGGTSRPVSRSTPCSRVASVPSGCPCATMRSPSSIQLSTGNPRSAGGPVRRWRATSYSPIEASSKTAAHDSGIGRRRQAVGVGDAVDHLAVRRIDHHALVVGPQPGVPVETGPGDEVRVVSGVTERLHRMGLARWVDDAADHRAAGECPGGDHGNVGARRDGHDRRPAGRRQQRAHRTELGVDATPLLAVPDAVGDQVTGRGGAPQLSGCPIGRDVTTPAEGVQRRPTAGSRVGRRSGRSRPCRR